MIRRSPRQQIENAPGNLDALLAEVRACRLCEAELPLGPRPVLRASATARILIVGQAPGTKVHATGIPWNDPSGDRLRAWMDVDRQTFYDVSHIAIVPAGYCYPGRGKSGDLPPRRECSDIWLARILAGMPDIELTILAGTYAHRLYLGNRQKASLTETVRAFREYTPRYVPLPHPSPRNQHWFKTHAWFEAEVVPELRARVRDILRCGHARRSANAG
ncbi:uracil-DNA glycosylase family protein [bacterium]|nr:uracil-DNA glycosylase family protein [bacterium]